MERKPLIITISIGLLIILGALGWFLFSRTKPTPKLTPVTGGSPFGQGGDNLPPNTTPDNPGGTGVDASGHPVAKLFRLSSVPVSGAVSFIKNGSTNIRYVERATGHIYDINPVTLERAKITNTTLPKIYEALFKNDGTGVIIRSLKEGSDFVQTSSLSLIPPSASSTSQLYTVQTTNLIGDMSEISVTKDNSLVYVSNDPGGIIHSGFSGDRQSTLFSSIFTDWNLEPFGSDILVTTKPSSKVAGYSYALNTKVGGLSKIIGPFNGLSVSPSSDGKYVAYSYTSGSQTLLRALNIKSGIASEIEPITLGEKCVWSTRASGAMFCGVPVGGASGGEPDLWYQGITHFSDRIWRFNTETGFTDVLSDPKKDFNIELDIENPSLSPDEDYLFFVNKNDLTLWALKLN